MSTAPSPDLSAPSGRRRPWAGTVGVTLVCLTAGLIFGTSAALARTASQSSGASDLPGLITARDDQVRQLSASADALRVEVEQLQSESSSGLAAAVRGKADSLAPWVGLAPVSGEGVQVTLDDAGYSLDTLPEGYSVDDVVVHQQDLQAVVNAMWAGGAEAVMVMDQRIVSTSSVQCVGNTLYLQGRVYSPPFTVTAIGDPAQLHAALTADPVLVTYRQWADAIGLGYEERDLGQVEMPGFAGGVRPRYARVAETTEPSEDPTPGAGEG